MVAAPADATRFPDRPPCFGISDLSNATCSVPSQTMIDFLNITNPTIYRQAYCLNPPQDSCAYGYCPNPDIASPAVRVPTYITTLCFSILILYSPDDILGSLYAQLLTVFSLIISAVVAIGRNQLTRLHAVFALTAAMSPLSMYLLVYATKSAFAQVHRLEGAFGTGKILNRTLVMLTFPCWLAVLVFISLPYSQFQFQQTACDSLFYNHLVGRFFLGPFTLFLGRSVGYDLIVLSPFFALLLAWIVAIYRQRHFIWKAGEKTRFPWWRIWAKVTRAYPFIQFLSLVIYPSALWILTLENGAEFSQEHFTPTYGQLLAIFVAVPPVIQTVQLLPRFFRWFADLTWLRFLTCHLGILHGNPDVPQIAAAPPPILDIHKPYTGSMAPASPGVPEAYCGGYDAEKGIDLVSLEPGRSPVRPSVDYQRLMSTDR